MTEREATLMRREERVAALEAELRCRRRPVALWWALQLSPWTAVELVAAVWLVVSAVLGVALVASAATAGVLVGLVAVARLSGSLRP